MTAIPDCEQIIRSHLDQLSGEYTCHRDGTLVWIASPYAFQDGDFAEVSVRPLSDGRLLVSDAGETMRHLASLGFDPLASDKGDYLLRQIVKQHDVQFHRGALQKEASPGGLGAAVTDVLMASLGVSHLAFLSRGYTPASFTDEVGRLLAERDATFTPRHSEVGISGKRYTVDFHVKGRTTDGLIQALSPSTPGGRRGAVNSTFVLWSDVPDHRWKASLLDDRRLVWREADRALLGRVSDVYLWSEARESFRHMLDGLIVRTG